MISTKLQIILLLFSGLGFILILNLIRKYTLELKYALLWLFLSLLTIILALFPVISLLLANILDIEKPVNALYLFSIIGSIMIIFSLSIAVSKNSSKIREMSQEIGLIKNELEELKTNSAK